MEKCVTLKKNGLIWEIGTHMEEMGHTSKNRSHLEKMGHTCKNALQLEKGSQHLEKWVTLGKMGHI